MATALINGVNYSWSDIKIIMFGVPIIGITKIDYKTKQEVEDQYGVGQKPISRGYGKISFEGSIEMYADEWKKIVAASPNKDPLQIGFFDIPVLMGGVRNTLTKDVLKSVGFKENPLASSQGDMKILVTIPLVIGDIEYNK